MEKIFCKKLFYTPEFSGSVPNKTCCLIGVITDEDLDFLFFKTAVKEYRISKKVIISVEDTLTEFKEGVA